VNKKGLFTRRTREPITRSGTATMDIPATRAATHIGSARGYQGLPVLLAIPATARPDSGEVVFFSLSHKA